MTTLKTVREALNPDTASVKAGVFTIRTGFYYRHGYSSEAYAAKVKAAFPNAVIVDHGEVWKAFSGGASTANQSHWWAKFTVPVTPVATFGLAG